MDEKPLQKEVGAPARTRLRVALAVCASISGASLGISLAALHVAGKVVVSVQPATLPDGCGAPPVLRATVSRASAEAWVGGKHVFSRSARIVPAIHAGLRRGWKVYAIRPGSLPSMIGLQNGDTLLRFEGVALTTAGALLEVAGRVRGAGPVTLDIERRGCPMSIVVDVL